jgi:hypothetical protein
VKEIEEQKMAPLYTEHVAALYTEQVAALYIDHVAALLANRRPPGHEELLTCKFTPSYCCKNDDQTASVYK